MYVTRSSLFFSISCISRCLKYNKNASPDEGIKSMIFNRKNSPVLVVVFVSSSRMRGSSVPGFLNQQTNYQIRFWKHILDADQVIVIRDSADFYARPDFGKSGMTNTHSKLEAHPFFFDVAYYNII